MITNYAPAMERLSRATWSRLLWWRFRLFQRHRHNRLVIERIGKRQLVVLPDVINPKLFRSGQFLADSLHALLKDMHTEQGLTSIIATHNPRLAAACDRVFKLERGQLHPQ